jgi:hypothetical protein
MSIVSIHEKKGGILSEFCGKQIEMMATNGSYVSCDFLLWLNFLYAMFSERRH